MIVCDSDVVLLESWCVCNVPRHTKHARTSTVIRFHSLCAMPRCSFRHSQCTHTHLHGILFASARSPACSLENQCWCRCWFLPASHISVESIRAYTNCNSWSIEKRKKEKFVERHHHSHKHTHVHATTIHFRYREKNLSIRWRGFQVSKDNRIKMKWKQSKRTEHSISEKLDSWNEGKHQYSDCNM